MIGSRTRSVQGAVDLPELQDVTLHVAAAAGQLATVRDVICAGVPVDCLDPKGQTALHYAVEAGQYAVTTFLLHRGANANHRALWNRTPLHEAASLGDPRIIEVLLRAGADVAVVETISRLTPLHIAVINHHQEAVDMLLRGGAPVQARDGYGATPLDLARLDHQRSIVALLEGYQHKMMGTAPRSIHLDIHEEMMADASRLQAVDHSAERDIAVTVGARVGETT